MAQAVPRAAVRRSGGGSIWIDAAGVETQELCERIFERLDGM